jgi:hypothetical protein
LGPRDAAGRCACVNVEVFAADDLGNAMKLHHVGMLVSDIAHGQALVQQFLGGRALGPPTDDALQQATVQFFSSGGVTIELIAPLDEQSHLRNVLARTGEGHPTSPRPSRV